MLMSYLKMIYEIRSFSNVFIVKKNFSENATYVIAFASIKEIIFNP